MSKTSKGIIMLLVSVLLYSIMPVLIRLLNVGHLPPVTQVFLRYIFAFIAAGTYFYMSKTKLSIKPQDLFLLVLLAIFGYALTNLFLTYAVILTQVGTALFIFYTFSIITPILGFLLLKEKFNKYSVAALILSVIALLLLFHPTSVSSWKIGAAFALAAAVGQSLFLIGRKKMPQYSSKLILLCNTSVGVIVLAILAMIIDHDFYFRYSGLNSISAETWLVTVLFGLDNFLAWFFMSKGFEYVTSTVGSMLMLIENIFALLFAFFIFGEIPSLEIIVGGMLIIFASVLTITKGSNN